MRAEEIVPILNVSNYRASVEWFEKVGFRPGFEWPQTPGDAPGFGAVLWDDVRIFLCLDGQGGRGEHGVWISIFVDDVDAVHARCVDEGLKITRGLVDEVWGVREFHLRHPDGHTLRISGGDEDD
jgi:catechol 2,3-dioxygenase-like lactoylglutathione lyase family enzyme